MCDFSFSEPPLVSVVIPFYNGVGWLLEAVDSVLAQTYHRFELILVDDGSTESVELLKKYQDPRIIYIHQKNQGGAVARNTGIEHAKGKYIAFLDADDLFSPNKLEVHVKYMEQHPEVNLSYTSYQRITETGEFISFQDSGSRVYRDYIDLILGNQIATPTVMIQRCFIEEHAIRFEEGIHTGEDSLFWIAVAKKGRIQGIDTVLTSVRMRAGSTTYNIPKVIDAQKMLLRKELGSDLGWIKKSIIKSKVFQNIARSSFSISSFGDAIRYLALSVMICPFRVFSIAWSIICCMLKFKKKRSATSDSKV